MAYSHIAIEGTSHGVQLQAYRNALKLVITEGPLLLDKMATMQDGEDYTYLETKFGLPGGTGAAAKSILTGVVQALEADPASEAATAGNASQLASKLDTFVDFVG